MSSATSPVTRRSLFRLYRETLRASSSFSSYNFREYFLRRTRFIFQQKLQDLEQQKNQISASSSSSSSSSSHSSSPSSTTSPTTISPTSLPSPSVSSSPVVLPATGVAFPPTPIPSLEDLKQELKTLKRQAIINNLYEAPRLVVEGRARVMTLGGGGAGAEASVGGGGQPVNPENPKITR